MVDPRGLQTTHHDYPSHQYMIRLLVRDKERLSRLQPSSSCCIQRSNRSARRVHARRRAPFSFGSSATLLAPEAGGAAAGEVIMRSFKLKPCAFCWLAQRSPTHFAALFSALTVRLHMVQ